MLYADPANSAFPLEPAARAPIAHDAIHRLYDSVKWSPIGQSGPIGPTRIPGIGGVAGNYSADDFARVHAESVRAMLAAGYNHRLRCDGSLDNSLPQDLFDRSQPPAGSDIAAQRRENGDCTARGTVPAFALLSAQEFAVSFRAQGALSANPPVDVVIPADLLARVKVVDPEPFLVSGMIAKVGTRLPVTITGQKGQPERVEMLFTREFLADLAGQIPVVQHPEHLDHVRGAHARRPNTSYMLAAALTADGNELWGKAWIPASQAEMIAEVRNGLAVKLPPAWSVEGPTTLVRAGDDIVSKPGAAKLLSIDWAETGRAGVPGAGPSQIVSAQNPQTPSKEEPMTEADRVAVIAALTLKELQDGRPDLVSSLISAQSSSTELEELRTKNKELAAKVAEHDKATITAQLTEKRTALLSAVKDDVVRDVADGLLTGQTPAELDANWPKVQERIKPLIKPMPAIDGSADNAGKPAKGLTC